MKSFYIFKRLDHMHENKTFFLLFSIYIYIATFQRKLSILIQNLYFYSINIQTNINQN
jgi:hypothetical protein